MKHTEKKELIKKYARSSSDTGSPEVQIVLINARIDELSAHLSDHKKDNHSRRGLLWLVNTRRKLRNYLVKNHPVALVKIDAEIAAAKEARKEQKAIDTTKVAPKKASPKKETTEKKTLTKKPVAKKK